MAPREGFEPSAYRLTAECSTVELPWNINQQRSTLPGSCPPSTIDAGGLYFCVRYGNRCTPSAFITGFMFLFTQARVILSHFVAYVNIYFFRVSSLPTYFCILNEKTMSAEISINENPKLAHSKLHISD